ncbi:hypothetical protein Bca52824_048724 [Brassica carinata]|uniref:Uncharacterized protein n=1 Tax=Brassica carinata TaxID=52824 RepID=A0A8X7RLM0_BRACI|nr:hypothetical protein Bca52824_048724 [Brassica carinata]
MESLKRVVKRFIEQVELNIEFMQMKIEMKLLFFPKRSTVDRNVSSARQDCPVETQLKRSILINAALSLVSFFVTLKMIPVAARYVLRRNTFGFDINKRGTPQGEVKGVFQPLGWLLHIFLSMVTMHSLIKLKSQEQKLALPEPALIKEKACYIDDDCDHRERQRISSLTFSRVDSAKHGPVSHTTTDYLARCKIGFTWTEKMVTNLGEVPLRSKKKITTLRLWRSGNMMKDDYGSDDKEEP